LKKLLGARAVKDLSNRHWVRISDVVFVAAFTNVTTNNNTSIDNIYNGNNNNGNNNRNIDNVNNKFGFM
jgi:hypothetical protein